MRVNRAMRFSNSTSARCPALGCALEMISRRQLYHSHTSLGFLAKASGLASSSGLYSFQRPPAPRKVGTPLSAEIPAPVKTANEVACASHSRACSISPVVLSLQQGGGSHL